MARYSDQMVQFFRSMLPHLTPEWVKGSYNPKLADRIRDLPAPSYDSVRGSYDYDQHRIRGINKALDAATGDDPSGLHDLLYSTTADGDLASAMSYYRKPFNFPVNVIGNLGSVSPGAGSASALSLIRSLPKDDTWLTAMPHEDTLDFWRKLGFKRVKLDDDHPMSWALGDGSGESQPMYRPSDQFKRPGMVRLFEDDADPSKVTWRSLRGMKKETE